MGGELSGSDDGIAAQLIAPCPQVIIKLAGVEVKCLLDTGSMVSTIIESFFRENFHDKLHSCHWLQLKAANGLQIPYLGYREPDIEVCSRTIPKRGVLVVADPPEQPTPPEVSGNFGYECYSGLI